MLSITKDLEVANGIKKSNHPEFVFVTSDNVEESYKKIVNCAPAIITSEGKYSLMFTHPLKLVDSYGDVLDIDGEIISRVGKNYFIISKDNSYKIMDADGQIVADNLRKMDFVGDVVSFQDVPKERDLVVTPDAIIILSLGEADVVASLDNGYYFVYNQETKTYTAYDFLGNALKSSKDLHELVDAFRIQGKRNRELIDNTVLFESVIISEFQRYPELCNYNPRNLLDILAKAASLDSDFYIDLKSGRVYKDQFRHLLKISDGKRAIWVPESDEEIRVIEDFCRQRKNLQKIKNLRKDKR